jgi:hypothetical protein
MHFRSLIESVRSAIGTKWHRPDLDVEHDEIKRTAKELGIHHDKLRKAVEAGRLGKLGEKHWANMDNTDSHGTDTVRKANKKAKEYGRDIGSIHKALKSGTSLPAPIVLHRKGEKPYLIGGNTRLMAARAHGHQPRVLKVHLK